MALKSWNGNRLCRETLRLISLTCASKEKEAKRSNKSSDLLKIYQSMRGVLIMGKRNTIHKLPEYKGYSAYYYYDDEDKLWCGCSRSTSVR
nr:MAG TPA: hypothetical protein [Caudoviricetes sp.]